MNPGQTNCESKRQNPCSALPRALLINAAAAMMLVAADGALLIILIIAPRAAVCIFAAWNSISARQRCKLHKYAVLVRDLIRLLLTMRLYARAFVGLRAHTTYKHTLLTRPDYAAHAGLMLFASRRLFYLFSKHKTDKHTHISANAKSAVAFDSGCAYYTTKWEIYWMWCLRPPFNFLLAYTKQIASLIGVCCALTRAHSQYQLLRAASRASIMRMEC